LALYAAQFGEMPPDAKPLKGFGGVELIRARLRWAERIYTGKAKES
jgi:hypothetical protein